MNSARCYIIIAESKGVGLVRKWGTTYVRIFTAYLLLFEVMLLFKLLALFGISFSKSETFANPKSGVYLEFLSSTCVFLFSSFVVYTIFCHIHIFVSPSPSSFVLPEGQVQIENNKKQWLLGRSTFTLIILGCDTSPTNHIQIHL